MIDALVYAVRSTIRASGYGWDAATCEIMDDERPPPRCGNFFASINNAAIRSSADNQLHEWYEFNVTLTMRVVVHLDRAGDQQIYRNMVREQARKQGFYAKADQLKTLLHMNWRMTVMTNQDPPSANELLVSWVSDSEVSEVYGFCEPPRFLSMEFPRLVGAEWFGSDASAEQGDDQVGVKSTLKFGRCRRFQPQTQPDGPFV